MSIRFVTPLSYKNGKRSDGVSTGVLTFEERPARVERLGEWLRQMLQAIMVEIAI